MSNPKLAAKRKSILDWCVCGQRVDAETSDHFDHIRSETVSKDALREAVEAAVAQRDGEWKAAAGVIADSELLGPKPIIEHVEQRAVAQEREALRSRLTSDVEHWKSEAQKGPEPWGSRCLGAAHEAQNTLALLDARSRAEEPK